MNGFGRGDEGDDEEIMEIRNCTVIIASNLPHLRRIAIISSFQYHLPVISNFVVSLGS
jgi:hypothetical protein